VSWSGASPDPTRVAAWIASIHAVADIVPLRFGDEVPTREAALELLHRREPELLKSLAAIRGKTEYGLRLHLDSAPATRGATGPVPAPPSPGIDYLRARAKHYALADGIPEGLTERVQSWLTRFTIPGLRARLEGPGTLVRSPAIYFLVPREHEATFRGEIDRLIPELGHRATLTGPWAPFNFARALDAAG
jgi:hypothetical protein